MYEILAFTKACLIDADFEGTRPNIQFYQFEEESVEEVENEIFTDRNFITKLPMPQKIFHETESFKREVENNREFQ